MGPLSGHCQCTYLFNMLEEETRWGNVTSCFGATSHDVSGGKRHLKLAVFKKKKEQSLLSTLTKRVTGQDGRFFFFMLKEKKFRPFTAGNSTPGRFKDFGSGV